MTKETFNQDLPKLGARLVSPTAADLGNIHCFKYADYDYARDACDNEYVRYVLDNIPIIGKHKRVLIDVKIHDLKVGNVACVPGWHLDGSVNPKKLPKLAENFTLFVSGEHALTEFLGEPITLDTNPEWTFDIRSGACAARIPVTHQVWTMPSCQFGTYDDSYFHRGKESTGNERRLLIRTTETDIIEPKNRIYTPYTHT